MKGTIQARFVRLFQSMEKHEQVEVLSKKATFFPYNKKMIQDHAAMLKENYGYTLPASVEEIANFPMELGLFWKVKKSEDPEILGEFHLENVINAISIPTAQVQVYNEDLDEATKSLMRRAHYFDAQPSQGWNTATVLLLDDGKAFPELWFMDDNRMHQMELSISTYFDALFLTKGMYYWQYLYCEPGAYAQADLYKKQYIARMMEVLPSLFPEADYGNLRERFEQVRS